MCDLSGTVWIFLDMGGTFVDETAAWEDRILRTAAANNISPELLRREMETSAAENQPEYMTALKRLGIAFREPWNFAPERLCEGAEEALSELHNRYKLGVIANQSLTARQRLEQFGVLRYFDALIISAEVGFSKPDPLLFREALYKAQTAAEHCVMIGDKLTNDIAPAKALGFRTIWVKREFGGMQKITEESMKPDYTVNNIKQAAELFRAI